MIHLSRQVSDKKWMCSINLYCGKYKTAINGSNFTLHLGHRPNAKVADDLELLWTANSKNVRLCTVYLQLL